MCIARLDISRDTTQSRVARPAQSKEDKNMLTLTGIIAPFAWQAVAALFMYCDCCFLLLVFRFYAMEMELVASTFKLRFF